MFAPINSKAVHLKSVGREFVYEYFATYKINQIQTECRIKNNLFFVGAVLPSTL